ncbi:hypothetical protein B0J18DRAFT_215904 [Chaetomium sp. MPI-SDFR-AT-0129]|uniref:Small ribosomal subunit protein uS5m n=1 Tax=Dichotomopilus funicola TaxID=1934379 RepID=A0AAN6V186_9PEZI|nr:hypothetical protein B0J18DRAFT_215904 [Chaetomium sp. MPI-SDFR-AT-0129]KAK4142977.1 hypothetical protein C8A04DRAFT_37851 [Dichotomopilus funicola]
MSVARPAARRLVSGSLAAAPRAACAGPLAAVASTTTTTPTTTSPIGTPRAGTIPTTACHQLSFVHRFHSSPQLSARRRPRFANVRASDMGLMNEEQVDKFTKKKFPKYREEELEVLRERYSPEQYAAIEAGEAAVDPRDLTVQGRLRFDPYRLPYIDDFAESQAVIDKPPRKELPPDPNARFMDLDEFTKDLINWVDEFPDGEETGTLKKLEDFLPEESKHLPEIQWPRELREKVHKDYQAYLTDQTNKEAKKNEANAGLEKNEGSITSTDVLKYILERSAMTDGNRKTDTSMARGLPRKIPGVSGKYIKAIDPADEGLDDTGLYQELKKRTGLKMRDIMDLKTKQLVVRIVSNQTRLGKIRKFSIMCISGNGNGWLGLGQAKAAELVDASIKARQLAILNMKPIRRYENRTIYGTVSAKVSGTIVNIEARPPGFGLRVPHRIFEMCRAAGITDLSANIPRSRNPMNQVKAAYWALTNQPDPEQIAIGRGKKLVDARKVYYGGAVY